MREICDQMLHTMWTASSVPGGFGNRGTEGMILAAQYARDTQDSRILGICLGMQMAIVEFARHVLGYEDANSIELDPAYHTSGDRTDAGSGRAWRIWEEP